MAEPTTEPSTGPWSKRTRDMWFFVTLAASLVLVVYLFHPFLFVLMFAGVTVVVSEPTISDRTFTATSDTAGAFTLSTVATILGTVWLLRSGIELLPLRRVERYTHAIAGASLVACGVAIRFLGL